MLHTHALGAGRRRLLSAVRAVAPSIALVAMLGSAAHAQTYYVDAQSGTCNNTGAGTQTQPYCTINAAITAHKGAGITIIVMPGTYREQVTVNASGASGSPFVLKASGRRAPRADDERARHDAGELVPVGEWHRPGRERGRRQPRHTHGPGGPPPLRLQPVHEVVRDH
jgi:hypothetical protein